MVRMSRILGRGRCEAARAAKGKAHSFRRSRRDVMLILYSGSSGLEKPGPGGRVGFEEAHEKVRYFFAAEHGGMRAVGAHVFALPNEVVLSAAFETVGPEIGAPRDPRGDDGTFGRIVIQLRFALD